MYAVASVLRGNDLSRWIQLQICCLVRMAPGDEEAELKDGRMLCCGRWDFTTYATLLNTMDGVFLDRRTGKDRHYSGIPHVNLYVPYMTIPYESVNRKDNLHLVTIASSKPSRIRFRFAQSS
jgi:hypothetical protein